LQQEGIPHTVRWYLAEPLSSDELEELLRKLDLSASELVRRNESYYEENLAGKDFSEAEWLEILIAHPELMRRPIVVNGDKAVIARPAARLREVL
jgi:arsenate reductase